MAVDMLTLFERRMSFPHPDARDRFARLVGIDHHISRLTKSLGLLVHPGGLKLWGHEFTPGAGQAHHQFGPDAAAACHPRR